ncbi:MAG: efflux RND transporter periplasmic adaptor subunit [Hyphomicrobium sp.]
MLKVDPTVQTLTVAGIIAIALSVLINGTLSSHSQDKPTAQMAAAETGVSAKGTWAASATGRVEPKEGEIRLVSQAPGEILEVIAKTGDKVQSGDLLVRLDDSDAQAKLTAALAEEAVRVLERDEELAKGPALDRRNAEDAVSNAERAVYAAQTSLDDIARKVRGGTSTADELNSARKKLSEAQAKLTEERAALAKVSARADMPLPSRLESSLTLARSDVTQVLNAIERTRLRAPADGTVLNVWAKQGEVAVTSPEAPLALFGDLGSLRVRTEVEERDVTKIRVGQKAVVKADAFGAQEFTGVVTSIAPALGAQRITSRGPRRPNDVEVLEVMVALDGQPPLLTGMRVDVFFKSDAAS